MLKRIGVSHLRNGMFIHEFCGSWLNHPFWRSNFLLSSPNDLKRIQESALQEVWIDTARGLDVSAQETVEAAQIIPLPSSSQHNPETQPTSMREEPGNRDFSDLDHLWAIPG